MLKTTRQVQLPAESTICKMQICHFLARIVQQAGRGRTCLSFSDGVNERPCRCDLEQC